MNVEIPDFLLDKIRTLLRDVTKLFDEHGVQYWLDGGTMLGCFREGGQIKHDDDADLGVLSKDMKKIVKLLPKIKELGYCYVFVKNILKICYKPEDAMRATIGDLHVDYATLDIFEYIEKGDMIVLKHLNQRNTWPGAKHKKTDLFPLQKMKFEDMMLPMPNNPIPYFESSYGD